MRYTKLSTFAAACLIAMPALAQDPVRPAAQPANPAGQPQATATTAGGRVAVKTTFPSKKLTGLNVRNSAGEKLGTVEDLVMNIQDGKVQYLALSVGGVLGIGDKLFAVPFQETKFIHDKDELYVVLDIAKEKLEQAPGFDKSNWPDFADPQWKTQVDNYYRDNRTGTAARPTGAPNR
jgi:sporulation protein YlmC with PRC-barrel domain